MKITIENDDGYTTEFEGDRDSHLGWKGAARHSESGAVMQFNGPIDKAYVVYETMQIIMGAPRE